MTPNEPTSNEPGQQDSMDLESDTPLDGACDLTGDSTCESCQ